MTASVAVEKASAPKLPPRRPFHPGTRMWDETGLITFSLTAGSAFLLQTMEPTISAVVDEHSTFRTDPMGRALRSLSSVMMWVYAGEEGIAEADRLRSMHATLNTVDASGHKHQALNSFAWAWVLHTGTYAFTKNAKYFSKRPMTDAEKQEYYEEGLQLMRNFSVAPKEIPADYKAFEKFFDDVVENHLQATGTARDYLRTIRAVAPPKTLPKILHPAWKIASAPVGRMQYFCTVGTTPEVARRKLGLEWTEADERKLIILGWFLARLVPLLPERLRYFPIAYEARKVERDRQRLRKVIQTRPI
ncbi:MAG TPA: oxygenase MpaB family protein [Nocardia sp.]|uniref:oxygenase MpaB family protein n=1 Tax=Nocardia TaxID=1817 RepID=UPI0024569A62|nr:MULTISPECIES: oxygenase MpaB family protein [Nocardia]HLS77087.1 oxygenase MpaB family protein [Nocardia sp.]